MKLIIFLLFILFYHKEVKSKKLLKNGKPLLLKFIFFILIKKNYQIYIPKKLKCIVSEKKKLKIKKIHCKKIAFFGSIKNKIRVS